MVFPCLTFKASPLNCCALVKGQTLTKHVIEFSKKYAVFLHFR